MTEHLHDNHPHEGHERDGGAARGQGGGGHAHGPDADADRRYLSVALGLIVGFMVVEVIVAVGAHSLALLADAGHMLTDAGALGLSLWAVALAARPAAGVFTFGFKRAEILSAAGNGITLLVVAVLITVEAIRRLISPPPVAGLAVLIVALIGIVVNLAATWVLAKANRTSMNVEGSFQHIVTDLYAFVGTAIAGGIVLATGWRRADSVASLLVVVLMVRAAWGLLRASGRVLLQAAPEGVDLAEVAAHLQQLPEVVDAHDLHAWTLTSGLPVLSVHVVVDDACLAGGRTGLMLDRLADCLVGHFDVEHCTFQLEPDTHREHEADCRLAHVGDGV